MLSSIGSIPLEASKRFGNKTALILADRSLSYNELESDLTNRCRQCAGRPWRKARGSGNPVLRETVGSGWLAITVPLKWVR